MSEAERREFSEFDIFQALEARLIQLQPKIIFVQATYLYNGKRHYVLDKVSSVLPKLASMTPQRVIVMGQSEVHNGE